MFSPNAAATNSATISTPNPHAASTTAVMPNNAHAYRLADGFPFLSLNILAMYVIAFFISLPL